MRTKYYNIDNRLDAFRFRWFPALCGSLVAPFIWFIILQVTSSKLAAGFGASLALLDTALLYQTRIAVLEPFLLPAVLTSIFFFSLLVKKPRIRWLVLSALTAGMCFAVKWTGLSLIGWGLLIVFSLRKKLPVPCKVAIPSYLLLAFLPYIFFFGIYYAMVPEKNVSYAKRFINDHVWIMNKNAKVSKTRKDSSKFYKWPLGIKPIKAISKKYNHKQIYRYFILIANPVVWIMCIIMIPFALVYSVMSYVRVREVSFSGWLVILYFMNWIPYALIKRAMFLYHYLPALLAAIILTGIMVSHFQLRTRKVIVSIIVAFSIFYFWLNYPLATGRPITNDKIKQLLRYNPSYYRLNRWMKIRTPSRL